MLLRFVSMLCFIVGFSGCFLMSKPDSDPPMDDPMVTTGSAEQDWELEVGRGDWAFGPIEDGTHLPKEEGPQGGHHIVAAARLRGANAREELSNGSPGHSYAFVEVEVVAGGALESRSTSLLAFSPSSPTQGTEAKTTVDFKDLRAYVDADVRGEVTITVKVASEDKSKWAVGSRHVFVD
jgi:hypothetical protein